MIQRIVKIVDYSSYVGFPVRISCLILAAGVATTYGFVLYFLPTPACWILIGIQGLVGIIGAVGAVSCFQLFSKLYMAAQAVLVIPICVIVGFVVHVIIYYQSYSCAPNKCRQSYYKGWLHDQGLLLLWVVLLVAIVGTGLLALTLGGFKKLISYQGVTHDPHKLNDPHRNGLHGTGNQTCQPIQQNPQTTVVINQSMPMMGGPMGGQMPGFMPMPYMMPPNSTNQTQSNVFSIPMNFMQRHQPQVTETTTTEGQESTNTQQPQMPQIPQMAMPQMPMNPYYPWFNTMPMMMQPAAVPAPAPPVPVAPGTTTLVTRPAEPSAPLETPASSTVLYSDVKPTPSLLSALFSDTKPKRTCSL